MCKWGHSYFERFICFFVISVLCDAYLGTKRKVVFMYGFSNEYRLLPPLIG